MLLCKIRSTRVPNSVQCGFFRSLVQEGVVACDGRMTRGDNSTDAGGGSKGVYPLHQAFKLSLVCMDFLLLLLIIRAPSYVRVHTHHIFNLRYRLSVQFAL